MCVLRRARTNARTHAGGSVPARARFGVRVGVSEYTHIRGVWKDRQMRYTSRFVRVIAHHELVTFLPAVQRDINMECFETTHTIF